MGIWVGRYAIVAGEAREDGPWLVERESRRDDDDLRLLVLADPVDDRSSEFGSEVAEAVAEIFARESLSITGGLLRALRQAHTNLAEWNRRSLREHQVAVGLTCVALRDGEATVAQVGPGVVYIAGPEGIRRLSTEGEAAAAPIGGREPIEPQFFSTRLEGRTLLMLTGRVDQTIGASAIGAALLAGPERTLAALYRHTRGVHDMIAVAIAELDFDIEAAEQEQPAESGADLDADERPPLLAFPGDAARNEPPAEAAAQAGAAEDEPRPVLVNVPHEPESPAVVDSGAHPRAEASPAAGSRLPRLRRQTASYPATAGNGGGRGPRGLPPLSGMRMPSMRTASSRTRGYALVAVAVLAAVLLAVCTLPGLLEEDRGAQLEDAIVAAQEHIASAAAATDDAAKARTAYQSAATEISRGRSISADDTRLAALQQQVDDGLARLNAVVDLGATGLRRVLAFDGAITAPFTAATLVAGGDSLWLVDSQRGRVFQISAVNGQMTPVEVFRLDASYAGIVAREPSAIAWDQKGQRLLILDGARNLFSVAPGGEAGIVPVRGIQDVRSAAAIASYDGNLYILDASGGEIWRYLPGGAGYDSERTNTLGGIEIPDARALVVDGEFFVLGASSVRHFRQDRELPPLFAGIDRALSSPAGLVVDPKRIAYVADRGGRRVVVSDPEGKYLKQYRHPQFFDLRGIAIAPDGATVYTLAGDGIYAFTPTP